MVLEMHQESIREGRLSMAAMLVGYESSDVRHFHRNNGEMLFEDETTKKMGARVAWRTFPSDSTHSGFREAGNNFGGVGIATDKPNFLDFKKWSNDHYEMMSRNIDSMLLAWHDPVLMWVPIVPSQDIWISAMSATDEDRYLSDTREFIIDTPISNINRDEYGWSVGALDFPFSLFMIRSQIISWWQAYRDDPCKFYNHCHVCKEEAEHKQGFADKWAISFTGKCNTCETVEASLSAAIPDSW